MSDEVTNLTVARFDKIADPAAHEPEAALLAALDWVRSTKEKPDHIIVITGRTMEDGGSGTRFFRQETTPIMHSKVCALKGLV